MSTKLPSEKLKEMGIELPTTAVSFGTYVPAVHVGNQVWVSGQLPVVDGKLPMTGHVGEEVTLEQAKELARNSIINGLAAINSLVGVDKITRVIKVVGFVSSAPTFFQQADVINGASDFLGEVFGDKGVHARSALGTSLLPLNSPLEIEMVVEVSETA
ncbi:RidA family protein [Staphylococcus chromogenes]|nr:RidA family protein [Staphylococcus chromogenes]